GPARPHAEALAAPGLRTLAASVRRRSDRPGSSGSGADIVNGSTDSGTLLAEMAAVNSIPQIPVAVFMTSFEAGGTEKQMTELIRRLDRRKFKVHAVCFRPIGAYLPRVLE